MIASVSLTFVETLPAQFVLDDGGGLQVLFFGLTVLALAWFAPSLASEVVQGQPHLSGADTVRTAIGASVTAIGGGMLVYQGAKFAVTKVAAAGGAIRSIGGPRKGGGSSGGGSRGTPRPAVNYAAMQPPKPSSSSGAKP